MRALLSAFALLCATMRAAVARARPAEGALAAANPELATHAETLDRAVARLVTTTRTLAAVPEPARRLANASIYLEAFGHVVLSVR